MSAWVVNKTHIDLLVTAGLVLPGRRVHSNLSWRETADGPYRRVELTYENADAVGAMLWAENVASVDKRYPDATDDNRPGAPIEAVHTLLYQHTMIRGELDPVVVLKATKCYAYQSSEHDGWTTSQASRFCEALIAECIEQVPGYKEAPWGFNDPAFFTKVRG